MAALSMRPQGLRVSHMAWVPLAGLLLLGPPRKTPQGSERRKVPACLGSIVRLSDVRYKCVHTPAKGEAAGAKAAPAAVLSLTLSWRRVLAPLGRFKGASAACWSGASACGKTWGIRRDGSAGLPHGWNGPAGPRVLCQHSQHQSRTAKSLV